MCVPCREAASFSSITMKIVGRSLPQAPCPLVHIMDLPVREVCQRAWPLLTLSEQRAWACVSSRETHSTNSSAFSEYDELDSVSSQVDSDEESAHLTRDVSLAECQIVPQCSVGICEPNAKEQQQQQQQQGRKRKQRTAHERHTRTPRQWYPGVADVLSAQFSERAMVRYVKRAAAPITESLLRQSRCRHRHLGQGSPSLYCENELLDVYQLRSRLFGQSLWYILSQSRNDCSRTVRNSSGVEPLRGVADATHQLVTDLDRVMQEGCAKMPHDVANDAAAAAASATAEKHTWTCVHAMPREYCHEKQERDHDNNGTNAADAYTAVAMHNNKESSSIEDTNKIVTRPNQQAQTEVGPECMQHSAHCFSLYIQQWGNHGVKPDTHALTQCLQWWLRCTRESPSCHERRVAADVLLSSAALLAVHVRSCSAAASALLVLLHTVASAMLQASDSTNGCGECSAQGCKVDTETEPNTSFEAHEPKTHGSCGAVCVACSCDAEHACRAQPSCRSVHKDTAAPVDTAGCETCVRHACVFARHVVIPLLYMVTWVRWPSADCPALAHTLEQMHAALRQGHHCCPRYPSTRHQTRRQGCVNACVSRACDTAGATLDSDAAGMTVTTVSRVSFSVLPGGDTEENRAVHDTTQTELPAEAELDKKDYGGTRKCVTDTLADGHACGARQATRIRADGAGGEDDNTIGDDSSRNHGRDKANGVGHRGRHKDDTGLAAWGTAAAALHPMPTHRSHMTTVVSDNFVVVKAAPASRVAVTVSHAHPSLPTPPPVKSDRRSTSQRRDDVCRRPPTDRSTGHGNSESSEANACGVSRQVGEGDSADAALLMLLSTPGAAETVVETAHTTDSPRLACQRVLRRCAVVPGATYNSAGPCRVLLQCNARERVPGGVAARVVHDESARDGQDNCAGDDDTRTKQAIHSDQSSSYSMSDNNTMTNNTSSINDINSPVVGSGSNITDDATMTLTKDRGDGVGLGDTHAHHTSDDRERDNAAVDSLPCRVALDAPSLGPIDSSATVTIHVVAETDLTLTRCSTLRQECNSALRDAECEVAYLLARNDTHAMTSQPPSTSSHGVVLPHRKLSSASPTRALVASRSPRRAAPSLPPRRLREETLLTDAMMPLLIGGWRQQPTSRAEDTSILLSCSSSHSVSHDAYALLTKSSCTTRGWFSALCSDLTRGQGAVMRGIATMPFEQLRQFVMCRASDAEGVRAALILLLYHYPWEYDVCFAEDDAHATPLYRTARATTTPRRAQRSSSLCSSLSSCSSSSCSSTSFVPSGSDALGPPAGASAQVTESAPPVDCVLRTKHVLDRLRRVPTWNDCLRRIALLSPQLRRASRPMQLAHYVVTHLMPCVAAPHTRGARHGNKEGNRTAHCGNIAPDGMSLSALSVLDAIVALLSRRRLCAAVVHRVLRDRVHRAIRMQMALRLLALSLTTMNGKQKSVKHEGECRWRCAEVAVAAKAEAETADVALAELAPLHLARVSAVFAMLYEQQRQYQERCYFHYPNKEQHAQRGHSDIGVDGLSSPVALPRTGSSRARLDETHAARGLSPPHPHLACTDEEVKEQEDEEEEEEGCVWLAGLAGGARAVLAELRARGPALRRGIVHAFCDVLLTDTQAKATPPTTSTRDENGTTATTATATAAMSHHNTTDHRTSTAPNSDATATIGTTNPYKDRDDDREGSIAGDANDIHMQTNDGRSSCVLHAASMPETVRATVARDLTQPWAYAPFAVITLAWAVYGPCDLPLSGLLSPEACFTRLPNVCKTHPTPHLAHRVPSRAGRRSSDTSGTSAPCHRVRNTEPAETGRRVCGGRACVPLRWLFDPSAQDRKELDALSETIDGIQIMQAQMQPPRRTPLDRCDEDVGAASGLSVHSRLYGAAGGTIPTTSLHSAGGHTNRNNNNNNNNNNDGRDCVDDADAADEEVPPRARCMREMQRLRCRGAEAAATQCHCPRHTDTTQGEKDGRFRHYCAQHRRLTRTPIAWIVSPATCVTDCVRTASTSFSSWILSTRRAAATSVTLDLCRLGDAADADGAHGADAAITMPGQCIGASLSHDVLYDGHRGVLHHAGSSHPVPLLHTGDRIQTRWEWVKQRAVLRDAMDQTAEDHAARRITRMSSARAELHDVFRTVKANLTGKENDSNYSDHDDVNSTNHNTTTTKNDSIRNDNVCGCANVHPSCGCCANQSVRECSGRLADVCVIVLLVYYNGVEVARLNMNRHDTPVRLLVCGVERAARSHKTTTAKSHPPRQQQQQQQQQHIVYGCSLDTLPARVGAVAPFCAVYAPLPDDGTCNVSSRHVGSTTVQLADTTHTHTTAATACTAAVAGNDPSSGSAQDAEHDPNHDNTDDRCRTVLMPCRIHCTVSRPTWQHRRRRAIETHIQPHRSRYSVQRLCRVAMCAMMLRVRRRATVAHSATTSMGDMRACRPTASTPSSAMRRGGSGWAAREGVVTVGGGGRSVVDEWVMALCRHVHALLRVWEYVMQESAKYAEPRTRGIGTRGGDTDGGSSPHEGNSRRKEANSHCVTSDIDTHKRSKDYVAAEYTQSHFRHANAREQQQLNERMLYTHASPPTQDERSWQQQRFEAHNTISPDDKVCAKTNHTSCSYMQRQGHTACACARHILAQHLVCTAIVEQLEDAVGVLAVVLQQQQQPQQCQPHASVSLSHEVRAPPCPSLTIAAALTATIVAATTPTFTAMGSAPTVTARALERVTLVALRGLCAYLTNIPHLPSPSHPPSSSPSPSSARRRYDWPAGTSRAHRHARARRQTPPDACAPDADEEAVGLWVRALWGACAVLAGIAPHSRLHRRPYASRSRGTSRDRFTTGARSATTRSTNQDDSTDNPTRKRTGDNTTTTNGDGTHSKTSGGNEATCVCDEGTCRGWGVRAAPYATVTNTPAHTCMDAGTLEPHFCSLLLPPSPPPHHASGVAVVQLREHGREARIAGVHRCMHGTPPLSLYAHVGIPMSRTITRAATAAESTRACRHPTQAARTQVGARSPPQHTRVPSAHSSPRHSHRAPVAQQQSRALPGHAAACCTRTQSVDTGEDAHCSALWPHASISFSIRICERSRGGAAAVAHVGQSTRVPPPHSGSAVPAAVGVLGAVCADCCATAYAAAAAAAAAASLPSIAPRADGEADAPSCVPRGACVESSNALRETATDAHRTGCSNDRHASNAWHDDDDEEEEDEATRNNAVDGDDTDEETDDAPEENSSVASVHAAPTRSLSSSSAPSPPATTTRPASTPVPHELHRLPPSSCWHWCTNQPHLTRYPHEVEPDSPYLYCLPSHWSTVAAQQNNSNSSSDDCGLLASVLLRHRAHWYDPARWRVWGDGDVLTVTVQRETRSIAFTRNGRSLGTLFRHLPVSLEAVFPVVRIGGGVGCDSGRTAAAAAAATASRVVTASPTDWTLSWVTPVNVCALVARQTMRAMLQRWPGTLAPCVASALHVCHAYAGAHDYEERDRCQNEPDALQSILPDQRTNCCVIGERDNEASCHTASVSHGQHVRYAQEVDWVRVNCALVLLGAHGDEWEMLCYDNNSHNRRYNITSDNGTTFCDASNDVMHNNGDTNRLVSTATTSSVAWRPHTRGGVCRGDGRTMPLAGPPMCDTPQRVRLTLSGLLWSPYAHQSSNPHSNRGSSINTHSGSAPCRVDDGASCNRGRHEARPSHHPPTRLVAGRGVRDAWVRARSPERDRMPRTTYRGLRPDAEACRDGDDDESSEGTEEEEEEDGYGCGTGDAPTMSSIFRVCTYAPPHRRFVLVRRSAAAAASDDALCDERTDRRGTMSRRHRVAGTSDHTSATSLAAAMPVWRQGMTGAVGLARAVPLLSLEANYTATLRQGASRSLMGMSATRGGSVLPRSLGILEAVMRVILQLTTLHVSSSPSSLSSGRSSGGSAAGAARCNSNWASLLALHEMLVPGGVSDDRCHSGWSGEGARWTDGTVNDDSGTEQKDHCMRRVNPVLLLHRPDTLLRAWRVVVEGEDGADWVSRTRSQPFSDHTIVHANNNNNSNHDHNSDDNYSAGDGVRRHSRCYQYTRHLARQVLFFALTLLHTRARPHLPFDRALQQCSRAMAAGVSCEANPLQSTTPNQTSMPLHHRCCFAQGHRVCDDATRLGTARGVAGLSHFRFCSDTHLATHGGHDSARPARVVVKSRRGRFRYRVARPHRFGSARLVDSSRRTQKCSVTDPCSKEWVTSMATTMAKKPPVVRHSDDEEQTCVMPTGQEPPPLPPPPQTPHPNDERHEEQSRPKCRYTKGVRYRYRRRDNVVVPPGVSSLLNPMTAAAAEVVYSNTMTNSVAINSSACVAANAAAAAAAVVGEDDITCRGSSPCMRVRQSMRLRCPGCKDEWWHNCTKGHAAATNLCILYDTLLRTNAAESAEHEEQGKPRQHVEMEENRVVSPYAGFCTVWCASPHTCFAARAVTPHSHPPPAHPISDAHSATESRHAFAANTREQQAAEPPPPPPPDHGDEMNRDADDTGGQASRVLSCHGLSTSLADRSLDESARHANVLQTTLQRRRGRQHSKKKCLQTRARVYACEEETSCITCRFASHACAILVPMLCALPRQWSVRRCRGRGRMQAEAPNNTTRSGHMQRTRASQAAAAAAPTAASSMQVRKSSLIRRYMRTHGNACQTNHPADTDGSRKDGSANSSNNSNTGHDRRSRAGSRNDSVEQRNVTNRDKAGMLVDGAARGNAVVDWIVRGDDSSVHNHNDNNDNSSSNDHNTRNNVNHIAQCTEQDGELPALSSHAEALILTGASMNVTTSSPVLAAATTATKPENNAIARNNPHTHLELYQRRNICSATDSTFTNDCSGSNAGRNDAVFGGHGECVQGRFRVSQGRLHSATVLLARVEFQASCPHNSSVSMGATTGLFGHDHNTSANDNRNNNDNSSNDSVAAGGRSSATATDAAAAARREELTEWACPMCTFINEPSVIRCAMCVTARPGATWTCSMCSYAYNPTCRALCETCGQHRSQRAGQRGSIAPHGSSSLRHVQVRNNNSNSPNSRTPHSMATATNNNDDDDDDGSTVNGHRSNSSECNAMNRANTYHPYHSSAIVVCTAVCQTCFTQRRCDSFAQLRLYADCATCERETRWLPIEPLCGYMRAELIHDGDVMRVTWVVAGVRVESPQLTTLTYSAAMLRQWVQRCVKEGDGCVACYTPVLMRATGRSVTFSRLSSAHPLNGTDNNTNAATSICIANHTNPATSDDDANSNTIDAGVHKDSTMRDDDVYSDDDENTDTDTDEASNAENKVEQGEESATIRHQAAAAPAAATTGHSVRCNNDEDTLSFSTALCDYASRLVLRWGAMLMPEIFTFPSVLARLRVGCLHPEAAEELTRMTESMTRTNGGRGAVQTLHTCVLTLMAGLGSATAVHAIATLALALLRAMQHRATTCDNDAACNNSSISCCCSSSSKEEQDCYYDGAYDEEDDNGNAGQGMDSNDSTKRACKTSSGFLNRHDESERVSHGKDIMSHTGHNECQPVHATHPLKAHSSSSSPAQRIASRVVDSPCNKVPVARSRPLLSKNRSWRDHVRIGYSYLLYALCVCACQTGVRASVRVACYRGITELFDQLHGCNYRPHEHGEAVHMQSTAREQETMPHAPHMRRVRRARDVWVNVQCMHTALQRRPLLPGQSCAMIYGLLHGVGDVGLGESSAGGGAAGVMAMTCLMRALQCMSYNHTNTSATDGCNSTILTTAATATTANDNARNDRSNTASTMTVDACAPTFDHRANTLRDDAAAESAQPNKALVQPLPKLFDMNIPACFPYLVALPNTTLNAAGELMEGQVRGSVGVAPSDKGRYYYEVVMPHPPTSHHRGTSQVRHASRGRARWDNSGNNNGDNNRHRNSGCDRGRNDDHTATAHIYRDFYPRRGNTSHSDNTTGYRYGGDSHTLESDRLPLPPPHAEIAHPRSFFSSYAPPVFVNRSHAPPPYRRHELQHTNTHSSSSAAYAPSASAATHVMVGWGTRQHEQRSGTQAVGSDMHSWGYNCVDRLCVMMGEQAIHVSHTPAAGDVIGALLDLDKKMMCWSVNGTQTMWVTLPAQGESEEIYPLVSVVSGVGAVQIRLHHTFYKPADCREYEVTRGVLASMLQSVSLCCHEDRRNAFRAHHSGSSIGKIGATAVATRTTTIDANHVAHDDTNASGSSSSSSSATTTATATTSDASNCSVAAPQSFEFYCDLCTLLDAATTSAPTFCIDDPSPAAATTPPAHVRSAHGPTRLADALYPASSDPSSSSSSSTSLSASLAARLRRALTQHSTRALAQRLVYAVRHGARTATAPQTKSCCTTKTSRRRRDNSSNDDDDDDAKQRVHAPNTPNTSQDDACHADDENATPDGGDGNRKESTTRDASDRNSEHDRDQRRGTDDETESAWELLVPYARHMAAMSELAVIVARGGDFMSDSPFLCDAYRVLCSHLLTSEARWSIFTTHDGGQPTHTTSVPPVVRVNVRAAQTMQQDYDEHLTIRSDEEKEEDDEDEVESADIDAPEDEASAHEDETNEEMQQSGSRAHGAVNHRHHRLSNTNQVQRCRHALLHSVTGQLFSALEYAPIYTHATMFTVKLSDDPATLDAGGVTRAVFSLVADELNYRVCGSGAVKDSEQPHSSAKATPGAAVEDEAMENELVTAAVEASALIEAGELQVEAIEPAGKPVSLQLNANKRTNDTPKPPPPRDDSSASRTHHSMGDSSRAHPIVPLMRLCTHSSMFTIVPNMSLLESTVADSSCSSSASLHEERDSSGTNKEDNRNDHSNNDEDDDADQLRDLARRMFVWLGKLMGNITLCGTTKLTLHLPRMVWKFLTFEEVTMTDYLYDVDDSMRGVLEDADTLRDDGLFAALMSTMQTNSVPATNTMTPTHDVNSTMSSNSHFITHYSSVHCRPSSPRNHFGCCDAVSRITSPWTAQTRSAASYENCPATPLWGASEGHDAMPQRSLWRTSSTATSCADLGSMVPSEYGSYAAASHRAADKPNRGDDEQQEAQNAPGDRDCLGRNGCRAAEDANHGSSSPHVSATGATGPAATHERAVNFAATAPNLSDAQLQQRRHTVEQILLHRFDAALLAMREGLTSVVPASLLHMIRWSDLQTRVCGAACESAEQVLAFMDLTAVPAEVQANMIDVVHAMSAAERTQLVLFCSGQSRLPLPERVQVTCGDDPRQLPTAHTCSPMSLRLQSYATAEELHRNLQICLSHCTEFGLV